MEIALTKILELDNKKLYQEYFNENKQIYNKMYYQYFSKELIDSCNKQEILTMKSVIIDEYGIQIFVNLYPKVETWLISYTDILLDIVSLRKDVRFRQLIKFLIHLEYTLPSHP